MNDQEILKKVQKELKSRYSVDLSLTEGDGTEYGQPTKISGVDPNTGHYVEVSSKIGNSWYFSGCDGVRIIAYGRKKGKSQWFSEHYRLLDVTGDPETVWEWLKTHYGVSGVGDEELHSKRDALKVPIKKVLEETGVNKLSMINPVGNSLISCPRIQYAYNDLDEYWESLVMDVKLPVWKDKGSVETSLIIQTRKDMNTGDIDYLWTVRKLRANERDGIKVVEELGVEKKLDYSELSTWLELYVKEQCMDIMSESVVKRQKESCAALIARLDK